MCLSIPGRVVALEGEAVRVILGGRERIAQTLLVGEVKEGDYVLVAGDLVVTVLSEEEASIRLGLFDHLSTLPDEPSPL